MEVQQEIMIPNLMRRLVIGSNDTLQKELLEETNKITKKDEQLKMDINTLSKEVNLTKGLE